MSDPTETIRRAMVEAINVGASREELEQAHGQVWDTDELGGDFKVEGFLAPFVIVVRKSDNAKGTLMFQHMPRFYFLFNKI